MKYPAEDITLEIHQLEKEIKFLMTEREKIYNNCDHRYHMICKGVYDDAYRCTRCSHSEWR